MAFMKGHQGNVKIYRERFWKELIHRQNGYTYVIIVYIIRNVIARNFKKHLLNRFQIFALHEPAIYQERRNYLKLYG